MKIRLCVNRKEGTPGYGSNGCSCEIELDVHQDILNHPEAFRDAVMTNYRNLEACVQAELDRLRRGGVPESAPEPRQKAPGAPDESNRHGW
jgi:hypothetical protein